MRSVDLRSPGATPMLQEAVHVQVGKQRANHAALRRSLLTVLASSHAPRPVVIALLDRHCPLQDDWPVVQVLVHKMHRAAGDLCTVLQRLLLRF